jgi:peptidoglycan/LPS O-acetylase OafA/YrhL
MTVSVPRAPGHAGAAELYLPHIDGLRALAVLAVVFYHLQASWVPNGFLGVDVFFVISGFVVSLSVSGWQGVGWLAFLRRFYARRLARIMPALLVCLLATVLLVTLFVPEGWLSEDNDRTGRFAFLGLANWALAHGGNDYFSPRAEFNPYTHTWSLGVEEQFYLLFPLIFLPWLRGWRRSALWGVLLLVLASACAYAVFSAKAPSEAFYMVWNRFWQLGAGVALFQWLGGRMAAWSAGPARLGAPARAGMGAAALLALLVLAGGLFVPASVLATPWLNLLASGATLVLIALGHAGVVGRLFSAPPVRWLGKVSYSLYLWHWPVVVLLRWTAGLDDVPLRLLALGLTLVLGAASYHWIENPVRRFAGRRRQGVVVVAGLLGVGLAYGLAQQVVKQRPAWSQSVVVRDAQQWYSSRDPLPDPAWLCQSDLRGAQEGASFVLRFTPRDCRAAPQVGGRLYVMGDSHAMHYQRSYTQLARHHGLETRVWANGGCAYLGMLPPAPHCEAQVRQALAQLGQEMVAGDVLFLSSLRILRMVDQWAVFRSPAQTVLDMGDVAIAQARARQVEQAVAELAPLAAQGVRIVLPAPTPMFASVAYRCADWFNRGNPICAQGNSVPREQALAMREPVLQALREVAARVPGATVWDPFDTLCPPGGPCRTQLPGGPVVFDGDHLSGHANELLWPGLATQLRGAGLLR